MKVHRSQLSSGNTLMVVLFFCMIMGIVLASILKLISARYTMTARSNHWNEAIPVLEAGIEEAMTHLHDDSNNYSANGWSASLVGGQTVYTKKRSFTDGSFFDTTIYVTNAYTPVIYSQGYVRSPLSGSQYISRMVMVTTTNPPNLFTKAITTSGTITLNGNVTLVDGFDSRIGPYSTSTNRNGTGSLASDSTAQPAISVGSASVYGTVVTGPGGTVSLNGQGTVGDPSWSASHSGAESGFTNDTMNVALPTNAPPTGTAAAWPQQVTNATVLTGTLTGPPTYYQASSYSSSGSPMIVTGNVIVYISGSVSITSHGYIQIMPGGSLTMIVGGSVSMAGGGVINGTGLASQFSLVGTTGCTSISYTGNSAFIGTINAPQADVTLNGGSDIYGAVVAKSATVSGGTGFHYDDALAAISGLVATGWVEK